LRYGDQEHARRSGHVLGENQMEYTFDQLNIANNINTPATRSMQLTELK